MKKLILLTVLCGVFVLFNSCSKKGNDMSSITWNIDNLDSIASIPTVKSGEPVVIETQGGAAVQFDGIDDGLIVDADPLNGAPAFTIEVVFRPDSSYPNNIEQRFVHIQNPDNGDRRILIETRLTPDNQWFLDTYIQSDSSSKTLYASEFLHPFGEWYHAALVFENGSMKHYVNGVEEMSGKVDFLPIEKGQISLGVRMNQVHWFKGAIQTLRITRSALSPSEFMSHTTEINDR